MWKFVALALCVVLGATLALMAMPIIDSFRWAKARAARRLRRKRNEQAKAEASRAAATVAPSGRQAAPDAGCTGTLGNEDRPDHQETDADPKGNLT